MPARPAGRSRTAKPPAYPLTACEPAVNVRKCGKTQKTIWIRKATYLVRVSFGTIKYHAAFPQRLFYGGFDENECPASRRHRNDHVRRLLHLMVRKIGLDQRSAPFPMCGWRVSALLPVRRNYPRRQFASLLEMCKSVILTQVSEAVLNGNK